MEYKDLTFKEVEKAFKSVKHNKVAGHDDIDSNVIIKVYDEISYPLFMIFYSSFNEGIFLEQLKVAKVSPFFKVGNIEEIGNYRPRSVLPNFSKNIKEQCITGLINISKKMTLFFPKQFGFQVNNPTHHAILNLIDDLLTSFEKGQHTLGVFIDLS